MQFYSTFPREIGTPWRRIVWNSSDFWSAINKYNQYKNVYSTVYGGFSRIFSFETLDYESCRFDRIYTDIDPGPFPGGDPNDLDKFGRPKNFPAMYECVLRLEDWLYPLGVAHTWMMSGEGFNLYLFVKENITHKKDCLWRFHDWMEKKYNFPMDPQTKGDVARISRVYGTFNRNKKRWCVSLTHDEVVSGLDNIFNISLQQRNEWHLIGSKRLDVSDFDIEFPRIQLDFAESVENRVIGDGKDAFEYLASMGIYRGEIPPCIQAMLKTPKLRYMERYRLILWLMDNMLTESQAASVLKRCLSPDRFAHCVTLKGASLEVRKKAGRCERQLQYLYKARDRGKEYYLNCDSMKEIGWCQGENDCATNGEIIPT